MVAHGAELGPTGSAGEEEQDGIVGVVPPDHQAELVAVDVDRRQFGDAALHRLTVGPRDRSRGGRSGHEEGDPDDHAGGCRQGSPPQHAADATWVEVSAATGGGKRTPGGPEGHRKQGQQCVEPPADHEGEHPVGAEVGHVHGRAVQRHPGDLEGHSEHDGSHEHRPARAGEQTPGETDREADDDRGQRRGSGLWGPRGQQPSRGAPQSGEANGCDPPAAQVAGRDTARWGRCGSRRSGGGGRRGR